MMDREDEEKKSFMTDLGIYCYVIMPFGLRNIGATYQKLVNRLFKDQIGCTTEVYVGDMLVKSRRRVDHVGDLWNTFEILRKYGMKLNPKKHAFGVSS